MNNSNVISEEEIDNLIAIMTEVNIQSLLVGAMIIILVGITYLIGIGYSKITGKNVAEEITEDGVRVASRVKRMMNFAIDTFVVINGINFLIMYAVIENASKESILMMISMQTPLYLGLFVIYYVLCEMLFGRTIGKFATGTKVIADDGAKAGFGKILGRTLLRLVPFEGFSFMGKKPAGWHDRGSSTVVVNLNYKTNNKINSNKKKYCKNCGNKIDNNTGFCNRCKIKTNKSNNISTFSKWAIIICSILFVGSLLTFIVIPFVGTKNVLIQKNEKIIENKNVQQSDIDKNKEIKTFKIGEEFHLKNGRKITIQEVEVGNYYMDGYYRDTNMMKAQISIRIHSDGGPLDEADYSEMYILKGNQLIKLSNSAANWGQYWFELPKTSDFENMKLYISNELVVSLTPYIKLNNL